MERARIRDGFHIGGVYQVPYLERFATSPLGWPAPSIVVRSRPSPGARALPILARGSRAPAGRGDSSLTNGGDRSVTPRKPATASWKLPQVITPGHDSATN